MVPVSSTAHALSPWAPSATVVVSQGIVAGAAALDPTTASSTRNPTSTIALPPDAAMATGAVPARRVPSAGAVIATTGAGTSGAIGVALSDADQGEALPRSSRLRTEKS